MAHLVTSWTEKILYI